MHRKGIVIGLSGGVDSALAAALSVEAVGKDKVLALLLPDKESSPQSAEFALEAGRSPRASKRSPSTSLRSSRPSGRTRSGMPSPGRSIPEFGARPQAEDHPARGHPEQGRL
ncbi:MAG: hypothetical protein MZU79_06055 [Anaerotruncus sp.]|nr:hypothetical protein [Anaerotruncus sp.]